MGAIGRRFVESMKIQAPSVAWLFVSESWGSRCLGGALLGSEQILTRLRGPFLQVSSNLIGLDCGTICLQSTAERNRAIREQFAEFNR